MKKIIQLLAFCMISISAWANGFSNPFNSNDLVCNVDISMDSTNSGDVILTAITTGDAPFVYTWNTGENTASVMVTSWGINYCVTVTDANGCVAESCVYNQNACSANIQVTPPWALVAVAGGISPFSYLWSNGSTNSTITPNSPGTYCVSITDLTGCEASYCTYWSGQQDTCDVYITFDTLGTGTYFNAIASGTAPFTYQWQPGGTTQSIPLSPVYFGDYCVTVTDATGCEATDCYFGINPNPCSVWIFESDTIGFDALYAIANSPNPISYLWSTGETSSIIFPNNPGTYCVTIQTGGCTGTACYNYSVPNNFTISGYLYLPDSLNGPANLQGIVELFFNDTNSNTWVSLGTTNIETDTAGWSSYYTFGTQANVGEYLVKATLDPSMPIAADYMPTYHFNTVHWDSADVITLPASGSGLYQIIFNDGSNFTGGSGSINGLVTEGDGFTANEENDRGGDPRPNTSVLLFDSNEQPITHTLTDDQGQYSFANLPFGTYKLEVEIVGVEQAVRWVTLSADKPTSTGNDFEVTPAGIVLGINDLVAESKVHIFPNPTTGIVNFGFEANANFDAKISVARADGKTVLVHNQSVTKGSQSLQVDLTNLPTGLYFLQVTTGNEVISKKIVKQ